MKKLLMILGIALVFASCSKDEEDDNNDSNDTNNDVTITSDYYFYLKIQSPTSQTVLLEDGKNLYGSAAGGGSTGCYEEQSMNLTSPFGSGEAGGVIFSENSPNCLETCAFYNSMIGLGGYGYADRSSKEDGVVVYYLAPDGTQWSTDFGTGDQTGSSFLVNKHIDNTDGYSDKITTVTFNCTLYDGQGNSMYVQQGEMTSRSILCW